MVGLESPTDNSLVQLAQEGCMRLCEGKKVRKEAIPVEIIKRFVDEFCPKTSNMLDLRFLVVCLAGFSGFLRIQELLDVKLKHVKLFSDHVKIFLPKSKADQHRHGDHVFIAATGTKYCPVQYMRYFLKKAELDLDVDKDAFLIPTLYRTKKGHRASKWRGISYSRINEVFHENLKLRGIEENYGLHSLRAGGASAAAKNGVSDRLISKQGRWASESARNGYIEDDKKTRLGVTLSLGL